MSISWQFRCERVREVKFNRFIGKGVVIFKNGGER
jgi:hypothetical protein